jgi:prevent-host-death family protein
MRAVLSDYMTIIVVMPDLTLPLAEIKKRLSEVVDGVEQKHDRVVLTRNGRPAAVILSPDDLESLEETLAILSNPTARQDIREAESEIDQGDVVTADELRAKYLAK